MEKLVGKKLGFQYGGRVIAMDIKFESPKSRWATDLLSNKAVGKVYGVSYGGNGLAFVPHFISSTPYIKFKNEFIKNFPPISSEKAPGTFQEFLEYGHEREDKQVIFSTCITESMTTLYYNEYSLTLTQWHDGVHLLKLAVNKGSRDKGIGTRVMNDLYDISEKLGIPIYLTPYPGEDFEPGADNEKKLVVRLEKWYRELGFDVSTESAKGIWSSKMWSNME